MKTHDVEIWAGPLQTSKMQNFAKMVYKRLTTVVKPPEESARVRRLNLVIVSSFFCYIVLSFS